MEEKDINEFFEKGDRLSSELLKTIFSEGNQVPSQIVIYAFAKVMAGILADIKEQTGQENVVEEYLGVFKEIIVNVFLNPKFVENVKQQREHVIEIATKEKKIAENEKKIAENKKKSEELKRKIAENEILLARIEQEMNKYKKLFPKKPNKEIVN